MDKYNEIWKPIPSLPGILASSLGRIMVVPFWGEMPRGRGRRQYGGKPRIGSWSKIDQRYVFFWRDTTYKVARLVCEAFHGAPPFDDAVCMHGDENSRNNVEYNLSWGTQKENLNAPGFLEYCRGRTGENSPIIKGIAKRANGALIP